jgi:hypothetical protein
METGQRGATARDIRDLCDLYGVSDPTEQTRMMELAREGKKPGWWQSYDLDYFGTYVGLEAEAAALRYYQSSVVPGLLQTADYAQAMLEVWEPKHAGERVAELLEVKLTRQQLLKRDPPLKVRAILDEAVLHRVVGGPSVMAEQLDKLIQLTSTSDVTIQVIAYGAGAHVAMGSTFNILDFAVAASVVYVEGLVGWIYLERPQDIDRYQLVFDRLLTQALSPRESVELIAKMSKAYKR